MYTFWSLQVLVLTEFFLNSVILPRSTVQVQVIFFNSLPPWVAEGIDECHTFKGWHDCNKNAYCTNTTNTTVVSYKCTCNCGFSGDGKICTADNPPVGISDPNIIPDKNLKATSMSNSSLSPIYGRLHNQKGYGGWCALYPRSVENIEVDIGKLTTLVKIATQGVYVEGLNTWVSTYKISYSIDGHTWKVYLESGTSNAKVFQGNYDTDSVVCNELNETYPHPLQARYVRVHPVSFGHVCMRFELYGDSDECSLGISSCHPNATCANTPGSYTCHCKEGFTGNGTSCEDVDECILALHSCHANSSCTNFKGSYGCYCNRGYTGNGKVCKDIDECSQGMDNCHRNATCVNNPGSYTCSCQSGFTGDGVKCSAVHGGGRSSTLSVEALTAGSISGLLFAGIVSAGVFYFRSRRKAARTVEAEGHAMEAVEHGSPTSEGSLETIYSIDEPSILNDISLKSFSSDGTTVGSSSVEPNCSSDESRVQNIISLKSFSSDGTTVGSASVEPNCSSDVSSIQNITSLKSFSSDCTTIGPDSVETNCSSDESSIQHVINLKSFSSDGTNVGPASVEPNCSSDESSIQNVINLKSFFK